MNTIYKYPLQLDGVQTITLPVGYKILSVGVQNEELMMWCIVNTEEKEQVPCHISIYGTGHPLADGGPGQFLGTVQQSEGIFIWHVFHQDG